MSATHNELIKTLGDTLFHGSLLFGKISASLPMNFGTVINCSCFKNILKYL